MFMVAVRCWGEEFASSFFGPFGNREDAERFRQKMSAEHSRQSAVVHEMSEPF